ncbi:MAG: GTPase HflX [Gammaproteobacteria bacterium]|nr:GTPase HflX [Gammaproteobacteria bacterium]
MIDRPRSGEKACLIYIGLGKSLTDNEIDEFRALAESAGAVVVDELTINRVSPASRYLLGSGKVTEIRNAVSATGAELVLFSVALSPSQERNLEKAIECRVLDRTGLILDIFASRAHSSEGKLQVELAQLRHLSTRLIRGWTHLERQKGGIGLRGPGETQLETDRRLLAGRIKQLRRRLERVSKRRTMSRRNRRRSGVPTVALVGYTNAGKSSLFNALTAANVFTADQLFATLDPTMRRYQLGRSGDIVLADTVGFVGDLPHDLVAAFRSTLLETREADLLLHVIDAADPWRDEKERAVNDVLAEIGAERVPQIRVFNKIDLSGQPARLDSSSEGDKARVWLSSVSGEGLDLLAESLQIHFRSRLVHGVLELAADQAGVRARLYELQGVVAECSFDDGGCRLEIRLPRIELERLCKQHELDPVRLEIFSCEPNEGFLQLRAGSVR